jgi:DNA-binding SARP family transcriptional activator
MIGAYARAAFHFERAAGESDSLPPRLAYRLGRIHYPTDPDTQLAIFARARRDEGTTADLALLELGAVSAHMILGDLAAATRAAESGAELARVSGDAEALASAHIAFGLLTTEAGEFDAAIRHYRAAADVAERASLVRYRVVAAFDLSDALWRVGRYADAWNEADAAVRRAEAVGFRILLPISFGNRAWANRALGRLDEAIADLERALATYEQLELGSPQDVLGALGDLHRERGDLHRARACLERALELGGRGNVGGAAVRSSYALLVAADDVDEAVGIAYLALEAAGGECRPAALLAAGWIELARGNRANAAARAHEALTEARRRPSRAGLAEALELHALARPSRDELARAELAEALEIWRALSSPVAAARVELALAHGFPSDEHPHEEQRARRRLRRLGIGDAAERPAGILREIGPAQRASVTVQTLGAFRILRAGEPVPDREWQSKKARELLKLLIARRGRPTQRELLMEALWPEEDPAPLGNRLSVALSTIRSVLDPGHARPPDTFVRADRDTVSLDLASLDVDVEAFLSHAEAGLALRDQGAFGEATDVLELAEATYGGDLLAEDLYADWTVPLREEARFTYIAVERALAELALERGDGDAAVRYGLRQLEQDPHDERAHLTLVTTLDSLGRHGEARRAYRRYVAAMDELGVEPAVFPAPARP